MRRRSQSSVTLQSSNKFRLLSRFAALCLASTLATLVAAKPISSQDLFRNPDVAAAELSPDGKSMALSVTVDGKKTLAVMGIGTGAVKQLAAFGDAEVGHFYWQNKERIVYSLTYLFDEHNWTGYISDGLFAINRDGSQARELVSTVEKQIGNRTQEIRVVRTVSLIDGKPDEILVSESHSGDNDIKAFHLNTVTGRMKEIPLSFAGEVQQFWADHAGNIRLAAVTSSDISKEALWYRDNDGAPWRKITELGKLEADFTPVAFDTDDRTLFVSVTENGDKSALYKFDFANNKIGEKFYANDQADVGHGLIFSRDTHKLFGVRYNGDQPGTYWIDEKRKEIQQDIDDALPGQINDITGDEQAAGLLVRSYSDTNPGVYYYYTPATHKLKKLFSYRPWLHADDLSAQLVFHYNARDGLDIPAYLTLPKGKPVKRLPLIVLAHGGPWARDEWGFDEEVQFLASRGYAVLQPQFRSSVGYGYKLFSKGWKQWGMSMQDDITDGVQNLIKQGVVDPAKVCIMGASYGGYAAMIGAAKDPGLYRCAIDMFGVTDIKLQHKISDWADDDDFLRYDAKELIGDLDKDSAHFDEISPLKQAAKIKIPVLMVYGAKDKRVPIAEGEKLRDVLQKQGTIVEWMSMANEGHGFSNVEADRYTFYDALDTFLKKYDPVE